jgi:hypothetical protein
MIRLSKSQHTLHTNKAKTYHSAGLLAMKSWEEEKEEENVHL